MYDDYTYDNDYDDSFDYNEYADDSDSDCDRCDTVVPNGHGHYTDDDSERLCGDCYEAATR